MKLKQESKIKTWFFEKNKISEHILKHFLKKREKTQNNNFINEIEVNSTDHTGIKRIIKKFYE